MRNFFYYNKEIFFITFLVLALVLAQPLYAAQSSQLPGVDLTIDSVFNVIVGLACWLSRIAIILLTAFIMWYGILFLSSRGDATKFAEAKKAFGYGLIGMMVILGAYSIIATVAYNVGGTAAQQVNLTPIRCPSASSTSTLPSGSSNTFPQ